MSEITERSAQTVSPPGGQPARSNPVGSVLGLLARQREATVFVVAVVLLLGLTNMMRGGSPNTSQKLMRLRVLLQFVAVIVIMLAIWAMGR